MVEIYNQSRKQSLDGGDLDVMTSISATGFVGKTHGRFRDFYRIGKILGTGGFGEVRVCVHRETGTQRAVKVLKKDDINEERKIELFNEISILRKLVSDKNSIFTTVLTFVSLLGPSKYNQDV